MLEVDLFLANDYDRTPILSEVKLRKDQCPFYALIQLLTQAAYAVTPSQRERLVLFGSQPDCVLLEAVPEELAWLDLYVLLIDPPHGSPYDDLRVKAIELSHKVIADSSVASRIGCIAWITGVRTDESRACFQGHCCRSFKSAAPAKAPIPALIRLWPADT